MGRNDEIKIFNGIIDGDDKVLKAFYKKNFTIIKSFVMRNSGNENDAEDVFQDGLIILYQMLKEDSLRITCSIHTYFYSICKNIWLSRLRKVTRISYSEKINESQLGEEETIVETIEQKEREQLYRKHFANLNCKCKQVLTLFFEGKSLKEIGSLTDYSEGYARKKKFECKKELMEMIEKDPKYSELLLVSTNN